MRDEALKFVRSTIKRYKGHMLTPQDLNNPIAEKRYHQEIQSLLLWEEILYCVEHAP